MGKRKKSGYCAYCGQFSDVLQEEHVIAKCFFHTPPDEYIKVMACGSCNNNEKSRCDNVLRTIIATDIRASGSTESQALYDAIGRGIPKLPSSLRSRIAASSLEPLTTFSGIFAGLHRCYSLDADGERALRFIVQGLYNEASGGRLVFPQTYPMRFFNGVKELTYLYNAATTLENEHNCLRYGGKV